ncbi:MAG TPA: hypothetical protein DC049_17655, partial [Spirochaetia bacterium]|nr:hypothetical protein [Spirochaetia bacterium]
MNGIFKIICKIFSRLLVLLLLTGQIPVFSAEKSVEYPPAPQWQNLGNFDIVPCPKAINIEKKSLSADKIIIRYIKDQYGRTRSAAQEIVFAVQAAGGTAESTECEIKNLLTPADSLLIIIGYDKKSLPLKNVNDNFSGENVWLKPQGYIITHHKAGSADLILIWGADDTGALYGAVTLSRLIKTENSGAKIYGAEVVDWPDIPYRIASGMEAAANLIEKGSLEKAQLMMKYYIRQAALSKCNSVRTEFFHPAGKSEYLTDKEIKAVSMILDYARSYGVRLHFFFHMNIGSQEKRKDDPRYKGVPIIRGYFMSWSHEALIAETCAALAGQVKIFGDAADYGFHFPDTHEGGWANRSDQCRKRWGDDRAAADAWLAEKFYSAVKKVSPKSQIQFVFYPYSHNLDYPGNKAV